MRFVVAILLSLLAHGVLAALLVACSGLAPAPTELAKLDLSSVDLSFADEEDDSAAVQPSLPSAASAPAPEERPPAPESPPEVERKAELPPDPEAMKLPEPEEERPPMETPETKKPEEPEETKSAPRPAPAAVAAVAAPAPRQARVDAPPRARQTIKPKYPPAAQERGEQGDVVLEFVVTAEGRVGEVTIVRSSGFRELDDAAVATVKKARFVPAKRNRRAVESTARLKLTYRLR